MNEKHESLRQGDPVVVTSGIHKGATGDVQKLVFGEWSAEPAYLVQIGHTKMTFSKAELEKTS